MKRPYTFNDIVGHDWLIQFIKEHIEKGTLHHFLILEGAEGLGKTSLADLIALNLVYGLQDSDAKKKAYDEIAVKNGSNDYIKKYKMSVEGGKEAAKEVIAEMHATFTLDKPKVIICDECHGLSDAAQDVFLADTEFLDDKVYMIMLTTELDKLKASLRSRALPIHFNTLKLSDMVTVLKNEVDAKHLQIQGGDATLSLIAEWAECKPRKGLNLLNAFTPGSPVSMNVLRELIGYMDVRDVVPLLASLSGSMTFGLSYISEMQIDPTLVNVVVECIKVKSGQGSYRLKMNDVTFVRDQLVGVDIDQLVQFLFHLTKHSKLTRQGVINAYLAAHINMKDISKSDTSTMLDIEKGQKFNSITEAPVQSENRAPSLEDMLRNSDIVEG